MTEPMTESREIVTIGYEGATFADILGALKAARVEVLVDVRELPNSRRPGFSRRALAAGLEEAGIDYLHLRGLGTPKPGRDANKRGDTETFRAIYDAKLETEEAREDLATLADLAAGRRAALLCFERDAARCHRSIVMARLRPLGFVAVDLDPTLGAIHGA